MKEEYILIPITKEYIEKHKAETQGLRDILKRFTETGCYSPENPNHDMNWCSCGKPFCYECVAWQIILKYQNNLKLNPD